MRNTPCAQRKIITLLRVKHELKSTPVNASRGKRKRNYCVKRSARGEKRTACSLQRPAQKPSTDNQQLTLVLSVAEVTNIKKPQTHIPITKIISRTQKRFLYIHIYHRLFFWRHTKHQRIELVFS